MTHQTEPRLTMFGIKNCDTIRKARRWLEEQKIAYHFHDYRTAGLSEPQLRTFIHLIGWQSLLNTRSSTWRSLSEKQRAACDNEEKAITVMLEHPTLIKRPLLEDGNRHILLGFDTHRYQQYVSQIKG